MLELPTFIYGGPFYVACDHKCGHGPANHGVGASGEAYCLNASMKLSPARVFEVNYRRVRNADIIFAFIEKADCYGTLIELGAAYAMGKTIVLAFSPDVSKEDTRELWMARMCANLTLTGTAEETWTKFLDGTGSKATWDGRYRGMKMNIDKIIPFPEPPLTPEEQAYDQLMADFQQLTPEGRREMIFQSCEPEEMAQIVAYLAEYLEYLWEGQCK